MTTVPIVDSEQVRPDTIGGDVPRLPAGSSAIVYCEGQFGEQDGKTANGLVRHY